MPGQHRGVGDQIVISGSEMRISGVLQAQRAASLRTQNLTWEQVAERAGYANGPNARRAVVNLLKRTVGSEELVAFREIEHEHLNMISRAALPKALKDQDPRLLGVLLKASDQRARLLGLNANEARMAGAAEVSAVADLAAASMLQASLIGVLHEVGLSVETIDRIVGLLNERLGKPSGDDEPEDETDDVIDGQVEGGTMSHDVEH